MFTMISPPKLQKVEWKKHNEENPLEMLHCGFGRKENWPTDTNGPQMEWTICGASVGLKNK
jgi:hypothetical protein